MRQELTIPKSCHCDKCQHESLWIEIVARQLIYAIGRLYTHPYGNVHNFINDLTKVMEQIHPSKVYILAGDTNINLIDLDSSNVNDYLTTLLMYKCIQMLTLPTILTDYSATCIDHIFVKIPIQLKQTKPLRGIFYSDISDHLPCFIHIDLSKPKTQLWPFIRILREDRMEWAIPTRYWLVSGFLKTKYKMFFHEAFPLVKLSREISKYKPWITKGIKTSILRKKIHVQISFKKQK